MNSIAAPRESPAPAEQFPIHVSESSGISVVRGTPKPIVDKLEATMKKIMASPEIRQRLESVGFVVPTQGGDVYTKFVKSEIDLWTRVIKTAGIKAE